MESPAQPSPQTAEPSPAWRQRAFEAARRVAALEAARQALADDLALARERERSAARDELAPHLAAAQQAAETARAERDRALAERDAARAAQHEAEALLRRITASTAWRITAPLRRTLILLLGREPGL